MRLLQKGERETRRSPRRLVDNAGRREVLQRHAVYAVRHRGDACGHRTIRIAERVYDREVVCARYFLVTGERHALLP